MENYSETQDHSSMVAGVPLLVQAVTAAEVQALLRQIGYRVVANTDEAGRPQLCSATSGVPFFLRFGNAGVVPDTFVDFTFCALLRLEGGSPAQLTDDWNASRRFARLHRSGELLVLQMDVSVAGGVSADHLACFVEIWDRLLNDLLRVLRDRTPPPAAG